MNIKFINQMHSPNKTKSIQGERKKQVVISKEGYRKCGTHAHVI